MHPSRLTRLLRALRPPLMGVGLCLLVALGSPAQETARPNILWITSEDNAAHWLGCYGNAEARTPRLDALAAEGLRYSRAYANAAVCAVARSTILNGAYAVTMGTQHMRSRYPIPATFRPHVAYLRELGYYCVNNSKTDYNFRGNDTAIWDESSNRAHYRNRRPGQPFFAIFNLTITHESQLFPTNIQQNRTRGLIPAAPRVNPATLALPPHVPDLPEMRSDFAVYHDLMTALDSRAGQILDELAAAGLADDTIVFYYADHGGATPRGKRYLEDTGTRVPLLVRVPEKWRALAPFGPGTVVDEPVSFVDLAPTLLSLCGVPTPPQMQGRAFLGQHRRTSPDGPVVFLFADRFDELYGMRRGLTDGRFKYIRRFTPHLPAAPFSQYQFGQAAWTAWRDAAEAGRLTGGHAAIWQPDQEDLEQLFDLEADPWEVRNLANDPSQAARLAEWRARLRRMMLETRDTGIVPEPLFPSVPAGQTLHAWVRRADFDYAGNLELSWLASAREARHLPALQAALVAADPVARYWGALGCVILGDRAAAAAPALERLLADEQPVNRITAAHALHRLGHRTSALPVLTEILRHSVNSYAVVLAFNTLTTLDALDAIQPAWLDRQLADPQADEYFQRFAKRFTRSP